MPLTAVPLSENWTIKECMDQIRSSLKEEDEQIVSDDNLKANLDWSIQSMFKVFTEFPDNYIEDVPFVVDDTASPMVSTLVRPASAATARPIDVKCGPLTAPATNPTLLASGLYDFHYEHPTNCHILRWKALWNELTGTCGRTSDYDQLVGHCLGGNTQLSRTIKYFDWSGGTKLTVSVREGMQMPDGTDVIIHGKGVRSLLKCVQLVAVTPAVPTSIGTDDTNSTMDETKRYAPTGNDWEGIDCPDDHVPFAINIARILTWGQVQKISKEAEIQQLSEAYSSYFLRADEQEMNNLLTRKKNQWLDRGHA